MKKKGKNKEVRDLREEFGDFIVVGVYCRGVRLTVEASPLSEEAHIQCPFTRRCTPLQRGNASYIEK